MVPLASRTCQPWSRDLVQRVTTAHCCPRGSRAISRNSAIARGLRETTAAEGRYPGTQRRPLFRKELREYDLKRDEEYKAQRHARYLAKMEVEMEIAKRNAMDFANGKESDVAKGEEMDTEDTMKLEEQQVRENLDHEDGGPIPIPYTTAASKFIYGISPVRAALIAGRRTCYKLYVHERALRRATFQPERSGTRHAVESKAEKALADLASNISGLEVKMVPDSFLPVMDKMCANRPHNGIILEASPLPVLPVTSLRTAQRSHPWFEFDLDRQSREEARINGTNTRLPYNSHGWRYPFILYLDGIVDEGNLGAIIRSAYYFGVDAVALSKRATAPLEGVALRASSGAAEAMPILTVDKPLSFLSRSALHGWRLYAADTPPPPRDNFNVTSDHPARALDPPNTSPLVTFTRPHTRAVLRDHAPLVEHPTILMLGAEGSGFRNSVRDKANYVVGVRGTKGLEIGVDSLNVSVAAALIMLELLRKPKIADALRRSDRKDQGLGRRKTERSKEDRNDDSVWNDETLF